MQELSCLKYSCFLAQRLCCISVEVLSWGKGISNGMSLSMTTPISYN